VRRELVGIRDRFAIDIDGGQDRKAQGNIVDKEDEIGRNGDTVAHISKRWFRGRQGESHGKGRTGSARAMLSSLTRSWRRLPRHRKTQLALGVVTALVCLVAAINYMVNSDGLSIVDPQHLGVAYFSVFALVTLDAVIPIFPGETTLNAASTAAAQGILELLPVIVMGALGAIVGDSALFWLARWYSHKIQPHVDRARHNTQVQQALDIMESSAPVLIVGGRYVPGMRFVVNATMGLSTMPYRRFLPWSILSGVVWSVYTCVLAYNIGLALADFPLASVVISGVVTTVAIGVVFLTIRSRRRAAAAEERNAAA
jgi:membrane-associated protein